MRQTGAVLGLSRTRIAASFHELGWSVLGRDCATPGRPTEIMARLLEGPRRAGDAVTMRQWRHVELPAILRIYGQNARRFVGPLDRDENYGRWLVSRGAFDSILVALVGQDRYELHESSARIVGYCIQSGNRVLEIMADPEFAGLEREILARVCAEAIENDRQEIVYESSAADPLHAAVAGGDGRVAQGDRMIVAKVFKPQVLFEAVAPAVAERVAAAGIRETVELGLDAPSFRGSVIVAEGKGETKGGRQATVHPGRIGRSYLKLTDDELARLLLGQCDPVEAVPRHAYPELRAARYTAYKRSLSMRMGAMRGWWLLRGVLILIAGAAKRLRHGGALWMVAQTYVPVGRLLAHQAGRLCGARAAYDDGRFTVWTATKAARCPPRTDAQLEPAASAATARKGRKLEGDSMDEGDCANCLSNKRSKKR
jgi:hypothetical protein